MTYRTPVSNSRPAPAPLSLFRSLKSKAAFAGVTGLTAFRPSGEAQKESAFFRIRGGEFMRVVQ